MGFCFQDRILIDAHQYHAILTVVQFVHECFQSVTDSLHLPVLLVLEEDTQIRRHLHESGLLLVGLAIRGEGCQVGHDTAIIGILDDDFLPVDGTRGTQSEQASHERAVTFDIEHRTVLVGTIGQEDTHGQKHGTAQPDA